MEMLELSIQQRNEIWLKQLTRAFRMESPAERMAELQRFVEQYQPSVLEKIHRQARRWKLTGGTMLFRALVEDAFLQLFHPAWRIQRKLPRELTEDIRTQAVEQGFLHDLAQRFLAQQQSVGERKSTRVSRATEAVSLVKEWLAEPIQGVPDSVLLEETSFYLWVYRACELLRENARWERDASLQHEMIDTQEASDSATSSPAPTSEELLTQEQECRVMGVLMDHAARDELDLTIYALKQQGYTIKEIAQQLPEHQGASFLTNRWYSMTGRFKILFANYSFHIVIPCELLPTSELIQRVKQTSLQGYEKAVVVGFWLKQKRLRDLRQLLELALEQNADPGCEPSSSCVPMLSQSFADVEPEWWDALVKRAANAPWKSLCEVWRLSQFKLAPYLQELFQTASLSQLREGPSASMMEEVLNHQMVFLVKRYARDWGL